MTRRYSHDLKTARHKKAGIPFPLPAVTSLASLGTSRNWPINEAAIVLSVGRFLGHVLGSLRLRDLVRVPGRLETES